jgi:hypothetical protein
MPQGNAKNEMRWFEKIRKKLTKEKKDKYYRLANIFIAYLDDVERMGELWDFKAIYDKILANLFVGRYAKMRMIDLRERF